MRFNFPAADQKFFATLIFDAFSYAGYNSINAENYLLRRGCAGRLNLPEHMAQDIYMFGGKSIWVTFSTGEKMIDILVDWFGKNFKIVQSEGDKIFVEVKVNENAIKYWLMQYGENVEVVKPLNLRESVRAMAENIMKAHS